MSVRHEIEGDLLVLRLDGDHTRLQEREAVAVALANPALEISAALLVDARHSTANPDAASIMDRARCLASLRQCLAPRCAVLVSTSVHYGLARMFAAYAENHGLAVGVFTDESVARCWLADLAQLTPRSVEIRAEPERTRAAMDARSLAPSRATPRQGQPECAEALGGDWVPHGFHGN
jgi:hypothetical protein